MASDRRLGYGSVITNLRKAIVSAPDLGLTREQLTHFCFQNGIDVSIDQFKDSMKRLINGKEVRRMHMAYYMGPKMRLDLIPLDTPGLIKAMEVENIEADMKDGETVSSGEPIEEEFG